MELPGGERVMLPVHVLHQLQAMPNQQDALAYLRQMMVRLQAPDALNDSRLGPFDLSC